MQKIVINLFVIILLVAGNSGLAQNVASKDAADLPRVKQSINSGWQFTLSHPDSGNWEQVNIPHTWNDKDPFDEQRGYKRTVAWYKKSLDLKPTKGKKYVLYFEAVNQIAEVFVNGKKAGQHKGGYTAFTVDITPYLERSGNQIRVKVDNRHNKNIPPLKGDFNFYGGIYRDVWLIELNPIHFDFGSYASSGIQVTTPHVSKSSATLQIEGQIANQKDGQEHITVTNILRNPSGKIISQKEKRLILAKGQNTFSESIKPITSPKLWHPDHPHLYALESQIKADDEILDRVTTTVGFRWFRFDADSGFFLNGSRLKLMGVNRHQDYEDKGNALSNARHVADVKMAKEAGSNFLRTAHYPQDPAVLEACDRLGLLVSMEIPIDHEITDSPAFYENSVRMQREMIRQNYNHPSIVIWAYMNEMLLGRSWEEDQKDIREIVDFARKMEELTRQEDTTRYTMIPNHGNFDLYQKSGLTDIPMIVGWNLYFGWYESELNGLGQFLDKHHRELPKKPAIITEFGAGSDPRIRSQEPVRFDFSVEWQTRFLQSNLKQITERPFVAGAAVWNLFDFGSESRRDAVPTINSKGLMSFDRDPKDAYYLLQSWLKDEPVVRIGSKSWKQRSGKASESNHKISKQEVEIYGNTGKVELFLNGRSLGVKKFINHIARWSVPFRDGRNVLRAKTPGQAVQDVTIVDFHLHNSMRSDTEGAFENIYINAGSNFYFIDEKNGIVWHPDEKYEKGFWGYRGGQSYRPRDRGIGSNADIVGTNRDPLFQTQRQGISGYQFDVPAGTYELVLLFSGLSSEASSKSKEINLKINGTAALDGVEIPHKRALVKKVIVTTDQNELDVAFEVKQGRPVINGIGIRKID